MTKTVLNWLSQRRIASIFVFILPLYNILNNILTWILSRISPKDDMMPLSYQMVWKKKVSQNNYMKIETGHRKYDDVSGRLPKATKWRIEPNDLTGN